MTMPKTEIDEKHHVSRYCKPLCVGPDDLPLGCAFELRKKETYLSVNWLEYYGKSDFVKSIDLVRQAFLKKRYRPSTSGKFVFLKISKVKSVIVSLSSRSFKIEHIPTRNDLSHAGIYGYTDSDKLIALKISELVRPEDVYPAKT